MTNRFKTDKPQAYPSVSISLRHPVNNTHDIVDAALAGLEKIYITGYLFQKVEVMATGLIPETEVQLDLFSSYNGILNDKLSKIMDDVNKHYGQGTLRIGSEGLKPNWAMKRKYLSDSYTTNWKDILKVK